MALFPGIIGYRGQNQTRYLIEMDSGRPGIFVIQTQVEAATVNGEDVAQTSTLTIAIGSGNYTATLNGETTPVVAFDTDDTTTAAALRDALRELTAAANFIITSAAGVITVVARFTGVPFTLTATGTNITPATPTAAVVSGPITIGTLVRLANGQNRDTVVPANLGDVNWGIAGGSDFGFTNFFETNDDGLVIVERGLDVSILRKGTVIALFEEAVVGFQSGILYRNAADGALDTIGILSGTAGAGKVVPSDLAINLLEDTFPLENGFHAGLVEINV